MTYPSSITTTDKTTESCSQSVVGRGTIVSKTSVVAIIKSLIVLLVLLSQINLVIAAPKATSLVQFNIPRQSADDSLPAFGQQANITVVYPFEDARKHTTNRLQGEFTLKEGIYILLEGSGLNAEFSADGHLIISSDDVYGDDMMRTKKNLLASTVAFFVGAGGVNTAIAQGEAGSKEDVEWALEEIVVTATKRAQNIQDVPISILALDGETLAAQGISDLQSLSFAVPGLLVAETGSFQRRVSIRGIGNTYGSSSLVGLYIDDTSVSALPANQIDLRIHDLERIEVLKGPQGTLYGEGSVGGTIRYITNDPELSDFGAEVSVDGSSTKNGDTSHEVRGIVNVPLVEEQIGLRVVGQYINSGGWIDQPALSKKDINDYELYNIRAKLLWLPTDDIEIGTSVIIHRNDVGAENVGENDDGNYTQAFNDLTTPASQDDYDLYNLSIKYDLGSVSLVSATGYLETDKHVENFGYQCCVPLETPGDYWNVLITEADVTAEVFSQELRISTNDSGPLYWSAGVFYKNAKSAPLDSRIIAGVPDGVLGVDIFDFGRTYQTEDSTSWAVFGEASIAISDRLELGAGLRYFEDDRESQTISESGPIEKETFDSLNPKVFAKYAINDDVNLYANIAKGFRSGGFNANGLSYDPESVISYEIGSKMSLLDGRLSAEAAAFYSTYEDYQVIAVDLTLGVNVTSNSGEAEIRGFEWSLLWLPSENLEFGFNGNVMDTEFVSVVENAAYAEGDQLDLVPDYGVSLWGNYTFNWSSSSPGYLRVDYSKQGKSTDRNRGIGPDYFGESDVIDMLNTRLGWENNKLSVEAIVLNLLNEDGFTSPLTLSNFSPRPRPRTLGINVSYKF